MGVSIHVREFMERGRRDSRDCARTCQQQAEDITGGDFESLEVSGHSLYDVVRVTGIARISDLLSRDRPSAIHSSAHNG